MLPLISMLILTQVPAAESAPSLTTYDRKSMGLELQMLKAERPSIAWVYATGFLATAGAVTMVAGTYDAMASRGPCEMGCTATQRSSTSMLVAEVGAVTSLVGLVAFGIAVGVRSRHAPRIQDLEAALDNSRPAPRRDALFVTNHAPPSPGSAFQFALVQF